MSLGCTDELGECPEEPPPPPPACVDTDPYCQSGPEWDNMDGQAPILNDENGGPLDPSYYGYEPPYADGLYDGDPARFVCPAKIGAFDFVYKGHKFVMSGTLERIGYLPQRNAFPRARYRLPAGPHTSLDGKAIIWSGTVDVTCIVDREQVNIFGVIITGTAGYILFNSFQGDYRETATRTSYGGGGWGGDGGTNFTDEELNVIKAFLEQGVCSEGWVIIVDDVRVC